MSEIKDKLHLHRGSDLWMIRSEVIGKKSRAQEELDKILSALKLQEVVKERIIKLSKISKMSEHISGISIPDEVIDELQSLIEKSERIPLGGKS